MTTTTALDLTTDMIDLMDIHDRFEELEEQLEENPADTEAAKEMKTITDILYEVRGCGGDEDLVGWRGWWYPGSLIRRESFAKYARERASECALPDYIVIDWEATANKVAKHFKIIDIGGRDYLYRK